MRLRNRMIKAEFYTDPDLLQWPRAKRELYRSLWAMAEDSYCIEDSPFGWKVTAWPSPLDTEMTVEQFGVWRDELIEAGKLIPYEANGKKYLFLPDMARHENPRNPQSPNLPLPHFIEWTTNGSDQRKGTYNIDWSVVQALYNTATTLPALPCPALPCPDLPGAGYDAATDDDEQHGKPMSSTPYPPCLNAEIEVIDPAYTGSCWGFIVGQAEAQFGNLLSHAERTELAEIMTRGCIPGCKGDHPQGCAVHAYDKLKLKGKTSFRTSRLWLKCLLEDRMEVRQ